jgi:hypothetical protein
MADFWEGHAEIIKNINARRSQELARKYFRRECPVNRMAARVSLLLAMTEIARHANNGAICEKVLALGKNL